MEAAKRGEESGGSKSIPDCFWAGMRAPLREKLPRAAIEFRTATLTADAAPGTVGLTAPTTHTNMPLGGGAQSWKGGRPTQPKKKRV